MRGAKQHRLLLQRDAGLALLQHLLDDVARLVGLVADRHQLRPLRRGAVGPEVLRDSARAASPMTALAAARIGCVER